MKSKFYTCLRLIRKERGYTQTQVADMLGISRPAYANYELGKRSPDLETLEKISRVMQVSMDALFGIYPQSTEGQPDRIREDKESYHTEYREGTSAGHGYRGDKKGIAIGVESFRRIREEGCYYTDKTLMIEEFLKASATVTLITRPRRFGKTLNMSMLAEFLDCTKDSREIFEGTAIMETEFTAEMNSHPVIFLSFLNVKGDTPELLFQNLFFTLEEEYRRHRSAWSDESIDWKLRSNIEEIYKEMGTWGSHSKENQGKIMRAIQMLSQALETYYGKMVYILIDEYDTPFNEAHVHGYYEEVHSILAILLSSALKGNQSLNKAVLTGIQRVAKENIFSGLNNLLVCTVKDPEYAEYFGFTPKETEAFLNYYGLDLTDQVKAVYDGYRFGELDMYNPWSVVNYASRKRLEPYWVNTSENVMIRFAMSQCNTGFWTEYEELIETGRVMASAQIETSFYEYQSKESLWGLLINAGMITIEEVVDTELYILRIPNQEVIRAFRGLTAHYLKIHESDLNQMFISLRFGKLQDFESQYRRMLQALPSCHDLKTENSYHMLMLGMCTFLSADYEIKSNRESGRGRSDITLKSKNGKYPNIIMEFKYTKDENADMGKLAEAALKQIREMKYDAGMQGELLLMGMAHCKKDAVICAERVRVQLV